MKQLMKAIALMTFVFMAAPGAVNAAKPSEEILANYLKIQESLAADSMDGVPEAAAALAKQATAMKGKDSAVFSKIKKGAEGIAAVTSIKTARQEFKGLSDAMIEWNKSAKNPGVEIVYCSMAPGSWLQRKGAVANPYYGKQMLGCGEKRS